MQSLGGNYRMTDIQAALGRSQLSRLAFFKQRRREIVNKYNDAFVNIPYIITPHEEENVDSCFHLYVLQIDFEKIRKSRKQIMETIKKRGIGTQVHYIPVNSQPYYEKKCGKYIRSDYQIAESYYKKCLTIPLYPQMSNDDVGYIIQAISDIIKS
jgi:dTDP-4-amino-4,6-dideoxygalactose transaminase